MRHFQSNIGRRGAVIGIGYPMAKPIPLLLQAATLRDKAGRADRLAVGLPDSDRTRLTQYGATLRDQADELERQAAAESPQRPSEESQDSAATGRPKKGRVGSNDPEPQA